MHRKQDRADPTDRLSRLQRANKQLRAEVRRLRKDRDQAYRELDLIRDLVDTADLEFARAQRRKKQAERKHPECTHCGSKDQAVIPAGIFTVLLCNDCGGKARVKAE